MAIEKMSLVQMTGEMDELDETLLRCLDCGEFHPEQLSSFSGRAHGFTQLTEENPYKAILSRIKDIALTAGIPLDIKTGHGGHYDRDEIESFLSGFGSEIAELLDEKQRIETAMEQNAAALVQIEHLKNLDVSLDDIFACKYVEVRFGRLPSDSYPKLKYYGDRMFIFISLSEDALYHWGVYFTTKDSRVEIDDIFSSLYFERIWIPEYVHGTPEFAKKNISRNLENAKLRLEELRRSISALVNENLDVFNGIYERVSFLNESYELKKYVVAYKNQFHIVGFIPAKNEDEFRKHFDGITGLDVDFKPPDSDKRLQTPTKLKNNRLFRPFEMFVDMYGTPAYDEIDPTPFVGVTYMLLFGIMFGDLGQGLAISLIGFLLWKIKKMDNFGKILIRIGFSSALFGLVYGSVFGLEDVLNPFYKTVFGLEQKPIEVMNPTTITGLLVSAIGIGVVLIVISMMMNILMGLKARDFERAVFGNNGLAGLVFYMSVLLGAVSMLVSGKNPFTAPYVIFLIAVPLVLIFLKHPLGKLVKGSGSLRPEDGVGSFIIEGIFELLEVLLSFVTNSLSFLRVGGFIISHAGMMSVVLMLSEMMSGSGSVLVLIIGNIFVMALEGFIVGIQVLRLEFYELFSRYFDGQGKEFQELGVR